jgi:hypothetical protein
MHELVCEHVPVVCPQCTRADMLRRELFQHEQVECPFRNVSCSDCAMIEIRSNELPNHRNECSKQIELNELAQQLDTDIQLSTELETGIQQTQTAIEVANEQRDQQYRRQDSDLLFMQKSFRREAEERMRELHKAALVREKTAQAWTAALKTEEISIEVCCLDHFPHTKLW